MSANQIGFPPDRAYNGDDKFISYASNLVDFDPIARISLDISSTGPSVGQILTIEWGGNTVVFTVAATINATATAWPVKSGLETLADYALRVAEAIRQNGIITEAWEVLTLGTVGADERIQLVYRDRVVLDVTVTENLTNVAPTVTDGTDPFLEPNLSCHVQVWKRVATADDDTLLGSLQSPYDANSGITEFNLKDYFELGPTLPSTSSINPGIISSWPHGTAFSSFLEYYTRANDKFGTPAVPLALIKSDDNYFMLHGSRSADHDNVDQAGFLDPLHRYRRRDGGVFRKPINEYMPDYVYFWALADLVDCNVEFVITWSDGTDSSHPSTLSDFDLGINQIHWVKSSPSSFQYTPPSAGAFPEYILFKFVGDPGTGIQTLLEVKYTVKITADWGKWILFDNGLGGCETALFYGKTKHGMNANRETSRRQRTGEWNVADGEAFSVGAEGQRTLEMNTGWIEKYYAEHLQQLLLGSCWLIDRQHKRFIRLICETTSVVTSKDDDQLLSLDVSFKLAFFDTAFNL